MIVNHFEAFSKHVGNTHLIKSSFVVYILFYAKLIPSKNCMFNMYSFFDGIAVQCLKISHTVF
ncbi:hypothetical protein C5137_26075 [Bacillus cereus]|jgi:hypothetical protein|nr:hypothetical protein [Bacillus cereus]